MTKPDRVAIPDVRIHKALSHPIRMRAMQILSERVASPSDIARELNLPVANVSYHVTTLLRYGFIEEVDTAYVRGAVEHFYRAVERPVMWTPEWDAWPDHFKDEWTRQYFEAMTAEIRRATDTGEATALGNRHMTLTRLRLDRAAFDALMERLDEVFAWASGPLQEEAARRLGDDAQEAEEIGATLIQCGYGAAKETLPEA
jgi:DNA-binding transcriptional ArsR family regulator